MTVAVTAVVPMYNAAGTIHRCLQSIAAQTVPVTEVIVVDDASTDDSAGLVGAITGLPIRLIRQPMNRGPGAARNLGARSARTPVVAFLDSDDEWKPGLIEEMSNALVAHDADFVGCGGTRLGGLGRGTDRLLASPNASIDLTRDFWRVALDFMPVHSSGLMVKRSLLVAAGGFPEDVRWGEDASLWPELWLRGRFAFVNDELFSSIATYGGLSTGQVRYRYVLLSLARNGRSLARASAARRAGTPWFAMWFLKKFARRHMVWLELRLLQKRGSRRAA